MEILLLVVVAVFIGGLIYIQHNNKKIDINNDGKVDAQEVKAAVKEIKQEVKAAVKKSATKTKVVVAKKIKK